MGTKQRAQIVMSPSEITDFVTSSRTGTLATIGHSVGSKIFTSAPKRSRMRAASYVRKRLNERSRSEPYSIRMRGG